MSEQLIATPGVFGENGNFLLERELGSGGMGGVYMGRDKMLDRPVAVKVMLKEYGEDPEFVEKFKKEAQAAAKLIHPNIAQIYSYGICDGLPYIAMELASGGSLYSIMTANPGHADIIRVLKICQQTAQALQCASDQGFVHGDVKPENILLDANGNAKLVDFGLAAMQKDTNEIWGTPYYISPEKVKKEPVDFKADMYSLGGTLYHALTGVAPFEADDAIEVVKKRFTDTPKKPSEIRPEITPAVDHLVMKMLALEKDHRYPSFEALLEAFKEVLTSGLSSATVKTSAPVTKTTSTKRMTVRGRRTTMVRKSTVAKAADSTDETDTGTTDAEKPESSEDDEEEGGNLGIKVVLFIVGGLLAIGAVIGGLIWFQVADKKSRERERLAMIDSNISKARSAISETRKAAEKFDAEFKEFAAKATKETDEISAELAKLMPEWNNDFKLPPTKELLDAQAAANPAPPPAPTPAVPAVTNAPVAAAGAPTNAAPTKATSPDKKGAESAKKDAAMKATPKKETPPPAPESKEMPMTVTEMHEIWEKTYSCQAAQIRISLAVKKVLAECDKAEQISVGSEEGMRTLGDLSVAAKDLYDQIVTSKDVTDVKKNITLIKAKGKKIVDQTVKRLRLEKIESDRKARKEAQAAAEKAAAEKAAAEKKARIEAEEKEAREKFDAIAAQGCFRQLDWKSAERQLNTVKDSCKTPEGEKAVLTQLHRVNAMKKVQDVFIAKMRGHIFKGKPKKGVLNGLKVTSVTVKEIQLADPKGRSSKVIWPKFYRDCPGNLNEAINKYIVDGRKNSGLGLKDWADAMAGAALTMQLVCSEVNGATERAEQLVKAAVEAFPDYAKTIGEMFPDMKIEKPAEE